MIDRRHLGSIMPGLVFQDAGERGLAPRARGRKYRACGPDGARARSDVAPS